MASVFDESICGESDMASLDPWYLECLCYIVYIVSSNVQSVIRRGRPRSETARRAVLDAAADLALEGAADAGIDAIAARAGVSRTTVYKWWPSAAAVLLDGLLDRVHPTIESPDSATTREALQHHLAGLVALIRVTSAGPLIRRLTAASVTDAGVANALVDQWLAPRRAAVVELLDEGVRRREVRHGLDHEAVADVLFAPIYYRLMYAHQPITDRLVGEIIALCWPGIAASENDY